MVCGKPRCPPPSPRLLTEVHHMGHSVDEGEPDHHVAHKLVELEVVAQRQDLSQPRGPQSREAAPKHQHRAGQSGREPHLARSPPCPLLPSSCFPTLSLLCFLNGALSPPPLPPSLRCSPRSKAGGLQSRISRIGEEKLLPEYLVTECLLVSLLFQHVGST